MECGSQAVGGEVDRDGGLEPPEPSLMEAGRNVNLIYTGRGGEGPPHEFNQPILETR